MEDSEREALEAMINMAVFAETSAWRLLDMQFIQTPEHADILALRSLFAIASYISPDAVADILAHPQLKDGITDDQAITVAALSPILRHDPRLADTLLDPNAASDGQWTVELPISVLQESIGVLRYIGAKSLTNRVYLIENKPYLDNVPWASDGGQIGDILDTAVVLATAWPLPDTPRVADDISGVEIFVVELDNNPVRITQRGAAVAAAWAWLINSPFLQTIEQSDIMTLNTLSRIAEENPDVLSDILAHPQLKDGITDDQTMIVAMLETVIEHAPHRVDALLAPNVTTIERRMVELPLSGEVELAIVRTYPRTRGTLSSMNLLENAVREAESLMDAPLPFSRDAVWLLFENAVPAWVGGQYQLTHMTIRPEYDLDAHLIAHEVTHYYWHINPNWLDEGMAEVMASVIESERTGSPVGVTNEPCGIAENIMALEALAPGPGEPGFRCKYSLGEGLFLDLLQRLGKAAFWEGARKLYAESQTRDIGIEDVRQTFGPEAGAIISRWYGE